MSDPSVETKIWMALRGHVEDLDLGLPFEWPMSALDKPTDNGVPTPYIEVRQMANTISRVLIASNAPQDRPGILQLTLCYPVTVAHDFEVMLEVAGRIAAHFSTDLRLRFGDISVRIERAADVAQGYRDDGYWRIPVSVRWRCYA